MKTLEEERKRRMGEEVEEKEKKGKKIFSKVITQ